MSLELHLNRVGVLIERQEGYSEKHGRAWHFMGSGKSLGGLDVARGVMGRSWAEGMNVLLRSQ